MTRSGVDSAAAVEPAPVAGSAPSPRYALLPADRRTLEEELLALWRVEHLFERTNEAQAESPDFVFFEGPPTANGRPGIHHVFARTVKDLFCRHRAMRGYRVLRKAGWDTHGLPVEIEVEKALGITAKAQIEAYGVDRFNELCRESVWKYRADWERMSERIGYWLDYANPYVTYSPAYVESVWWALRTLWERGLLYSGYKILPYCPRCETALSSHELALGYRDVEDPSVYVALDLDEAGRRILVWTTTPWTLVANVALAVHPELEYVEVRARSGTDRRSLILAASRVVPLLGEDHDARWETIGRFAGSELVGRHYHRPLHWVPFPSAIGDHEVIVGESFVSADDGSGIVHLAPAFGADDYAAGGRHGLAFLQPVTGRGEFAATVPVVGGMGVKQANDPIIAELGQHGVLWSTERLTHAYPHCWRCGTPLIYYARSSWFVRTTAFADEMLARNRRIEWQPPEVGSGRFGEWLAGNIDWALSRDRYWGTPLPVWVCDANAAHVEVIGSYDALARRRGAPLPAEFDPHKPGIDGYDWSCGTCSGTMRRVSEVIDTWFDSGSMPFAQWHYPFEQREVFARQYPADFIAEGVDQTRGWFYSLLAIAAGLGDALPGNEAGQAAPYRHVVVNDLVLDAAGQKMSKSRGNAVDPWQVIGQHGADAVRLFLIDTSQVWVPRRFDEHAIRKTAGQFLVTLQNTYDGMFATYANFGWSPSPLDPPPSERPPLDRWMLSRLARVERAADDLLGRYEPTLALRAVKQFVVDDVSNWYVRLSRSRFYDVDTPDSRAAFATLHETLAVTARLLAPFAPFVTDWLHRQLTTRSVHLASYVRSETTTDIDDALEAAMDDVRRLAGLGRSAREQAGIRTRQPLARLVCVVPRTSHRLGGSAVTLGELTPLLRSELNVKDVEWLASGDTLVALIAKANFRTLGKKFGKHTPLAAEAVARFTNAELRAFLNGAPLAVTVDSMTHHLDREDLKIEQQPAGDLVFAEEDGYVAAIDPRVSPELAREGLARELISAVQRMRKEAELAVSDRIRLVIAGAPAIEAAAREHTAWIASEVLATELQVGRPLGGTLGGPPGCDAERTLDLDGLSVRIAFTREVEP